MQLSQAVALEIVWRTDQNLNLYFKHFSPFFFFFYGFYQNLSWKFLVQYYILLAVSREQRVLPATPEVTTSNKSRGVSPGGAPGEDVIWDSAYARSALAIELFSVQNMHLTEGSSDFSDTRTCVALCMTNFIAWNGAVEWIKWSIYSKVFEELGLPSYFIVDICFPEMP